jgi:hypothetical protein
MNFKTQDSALTENRGRVVSILILKVDASVVLCGI